MSRYAPEGGLLMRSLMLINDQHGYVKPDEYFCPGFAHKRINGELVTIPNSMWALPAVVAQELLKQRKACHVYETDSH